MSVVLIDRMQPRQLQIKMFSVFTCMKKKTKSDYSVGGDTISFVPAVRTQNDHIKVSSRQFQLKL